MARLKRVLNLLERYDGLAAAGVSSHNSELGKLLLEELRAEKETLTQELTEYGCSQIIDVLNEEEEY